jgi:hypothetical protein
MLTAFFIISGISWTFANESSSDLEIGDPLGTANVSKIKAIIDDQIIPSLDVQGRTVVMLQDLANYGFDIFWDEKLKTLEIIRNTQKPFTPVTHAYKTPRQIIYSDIKSYTGNIQQILMYNIDGQAAVCFEDLGTFGKLKRDERKGIISLKLRSKLPQEKIPAKIRGKYFLNLDVQNPYHKTFQYTDVYYENGQFVFTDGYALSFERNEILVGRTVSLSETGIYLGTLLRSYRYSDYGTKILSNDDYEIQREYLVSQKYRDYAAMIVHGIEQKKEHVNAE